jgi:biopolymer transport protein ExbB
MNMFDELKDVLTHAGTAWVLWILVSLSVAALGVMLDRARVFWVQRDDFPTLVRAIHYALGQGDIEGARRRLLTSPSAEAAVGLAGLDNWSRGTPAAREAMAAASGLQRARMEKRLLFLGTVGNNAPFVGLLGTVIGVVGAFQELGDSTLSSSSGALAPERIMSTIGEALVATAVGLVVAIPAVAVFNFFNGLMSTALSNAETLGHVLLSHMNAQKDEA